MTDYTLSITTERPYDETVAAVREQLAEADFDPAIMTTFVDDPSEPLRGISEDARSRLISAPEALSAADTAEGSK